MWYNKYVGLPFLEKGRTAEGLDCWGLARLVYKEQFEIDLPSFTSEYASVSDAEHLQELIAINKEGWEAVDTPKEGDLLLISINGSASHVGIAINETQFLHVRENRDSAIEAINARLWKNRILGAYRYSPKSASLTVVPHPLRTERYVVPITPGTTLAELVENITKDYNIQPELKSKTIILVNTIPIPSNEWGITILKEHDIVDYRAIPQGGNTFRMLAMLALSLASGGLVGALSGTAGVGGVAGTGLAGALGITTTSMITINMLTSVVQFGIMMVGGALINAIAPIRPPSANDPGQTKQQYLFNGAANSVSQYGAIPVVLGKVRLTPPLGAINYVRHTNETDSYILMLLVWGYGPLYVNTGTLQVGNTPLNDYEFKNIQTIDYRTTPTSDQLANMSYGRERDQRVTNDDLVCPGLPAIYYKNSDGSLYVDYSDYTDLYTYKSYYYDLIKYSSTYPTWTSALFIPTMNGPVVSATIADIYIAIQFPEGLRRIINTGDDAGQDYVAPVSFEIEYRTYSAAVGGTAGAWQPYTPTGSRYIVGHKSPKKDAFTHVVSLMNSGTEDKYRSLARNQAVAVEVRIRRISGSESSPTGFPAWEIGHTYAAGDLVHVKVITESTPLVYGPDGEIIGGGTFVTSTYTAGRYKALTPHTAGTSFALDLAASKWVYYGDAEGWVDAPKYKDFTYQHRAIVHSITAELNGAPYIFPKDCTLAMTSIDLKATNQLNGQLEGISGEVQTWCIDYNVPIDATHPAGPATMPNWNYNATSNPASLFIYVLSHPANPQRIDISSLEGVDKLDLPSIQAWHAYCNGTNPKGIIYQFNSVLSDAKSVLDTLRDICSAGRASPVFKDGKWGVNIDQEKSTIVQHFSPHNSWGFEGSKALPKFPDAIKTTIPDETNSYQSREIVVYNTGKNNTSAKLFETISLPGITNIDLAIDHIRWHMAQAKLRPEVYTFNTDIEYLVCNRGDRVVVAHDVPMWGTGSGRVKTRLSSKLFDIDEPVSIDSSKNYTIRIRSNTGSTNETSLVLSYSVAYVSRTSNIVTITLSGSEHPIRENDYISVNTSNSSVNTSNVQVTSVTSNTVSYTLSGTNILTSSSTGTIKLASGMYNRIMTNDAFTSGQVDFQDLFLFGEYQQESQDLLVLSIEPTANNSAKLTLVDYGVTPTYNLFTQYDTLTEATTFESNITLPTLKLINSFKDTDIPGLVSSDIKSDYTAANLASPGTPILNIMVPFTNINGLPSNVESVECQYDYSEVTSTGSYKSINVSYLLGAVSITGVAKGEKYKIRLRYVSRDGRTGPWSDWAVHQVVGIEWYLVSLDLIYPVIEGKYLNITPNPSFVKGADFKAFEYRVRRTGNTTDNSDFWSSSNLDNPEIKIVRSQSNGVVDLTEFSNATIPRFDADGIYYTIACRAMNTTNEYSLTSALYTIAITSLT